MKIKGDKILENLGRKLLSAGVSMLIVLNCVDAVRCSAFGNNKNCDKIITGMNENFNRTLGLLNEEISGYKLKMTGYERKIEDLENARDEALNKLNHCEKDPICKDALECANGNIRFCRYYEQHIKDLKKARDEALNKLNYCEGIKAEKDRKEIDYWLEYWLNLSLKTFLLFLVTHEVIPRLRNFGVQMQVHF